MWLFIFSIGGRNIFRLHPGAAARCQMPNAKMKFTSFVYLYRSCPVVLPKHVLGENCAAIHFLHFYVARPEEDEEAANTSQI